MTPAFRACDMSTPAPAPAADPSIRQVSGLGPESVHDWILRYTHFAAFLSATGRPQDAEQVVRKALAICEKLCMEDPANAGYWFGAGVAHSNLGQSDKAIPCFTKVVELKPGFWQA